MSILKLNAAEKKKKYELCPVRNVLNRIGDKWSLLVLIELSNTEVMRFNELSSALEDISQKMLTVTLRTLEADGLVNRTMFPQIPPRVEYSLTERGRSLLPHVHALARWAYENQDAILQQREEFA
jgi:DNA-binding HxlR family transcriptional regulator